MEENEMKKRVYVFMCPHCKEETFWREEDDPPLSCSYCDKKMPIKIKRYPEEESGKIPNNWNTTSYPEIS